MPRREQWEDRRSAAEPSVVRNRDYGHPVTRHTRRNWLIVSCSQPKRAESCHLTRVAASWLCPYFPRQCSLDNSQMEFRCGAWVMRDRGNILSCQQVAGCVGIWLWAAPGDEIHRTCPKYSPSCPQPPLSYYWYHPTSDTQLNTSSFASNSLATCSQFAGILWPGSGLAQTSQTRNNT